MQRVKERKQSCQHIGRWQDLGQIGIKKLLLFTLMKKIKNIKQWITSLLKREVLKPLNTSSPKYNTIDLPLEVFINALVDNDFSEIENWQAVYLDYCDIVGGQELLTILEKQIEISELECRVTKANCLISILENSLYEEHCKIIFNSLLELGYPSSVTEYSKDTVKRFLDDIIPHIKLDATDAEILRNLIKRPNNEEGNKYTRNYFASMIISIQKELNVKIEMKDSTRMYAICVLQLRQLIEHKNKAL